MTPSFREIVGEAVAGLSRNRTRAVLSTVGIAWGIVSVVMLLSYGNGFRDALARGFRGAFGDAVVVMWPGQTSQQAGGVASRSCGRKDVFRSTSSANGAPAR